MKGGNTLRAVLQGGLQIVRTPAASTTLYSFSAPAFLRLLSSNNNSRTGDGGMLLQHQQNRHVAASAGSGAGKNSVVRNPTMLYAATSNSGNKRAKAAGGGTPSSASAAVPKDLVLKTVPGIGKVYMQRLQAEGISSVDKLADTILDKLSRAETSFLPAVQHLQVRGWLTAARRQAGRRAGACAGSDRNQQCRCRRQTAGTSHGTALLHPARNIVCAAPCRSSASSARTMPSAS